MKNSEKQRLLELLADKTLFGLSREESMQLKQLKDEFPDWEDDISLELTAAMIGLSTLESKDDLPSDLRAKIFANAEDFFKTEKEVKTSEFFAGNSRSSSLSATANVGEVNSIESKTSPWQWLGWGLAAAACVALAINLWVTQSQKPNEIVKTIETIQTPTPELTTAQKRDQLIASASDAVKISLTNPKNEKEIMGDMVWSNSQQKGYARFRKLPVNDPQKQTYQLWIVDESQNEKTPISGGVFDVDNSGEIIVPVNAQIHVTKPKAIAVTMEKAGGVVVSQQEKVVAFAKI